MIWHGLKVFDLIFEKDIMIVCRWIIDISYLAFMYQNLMPPSINSGSVSFDRLESVRVNEPLRGRKHFEVVSSYPFRFYCCRQYLTSNVAIFEGLLSTTCPSKRAKGAPRQK